MNENHTTNELIQKVNGLRSQLRGKNPDVGKIISRMEEIISILEQHERKIQNALTQQEKEIYYKLI